MTDEREQRVDQSFIKRKENCGKYVIIPIDKKFSQTKPVTTARYLCIM